MSDFYALHSEKNGEGWCFCVAWWVPTWDGWGQRTAQQNRQLRESLCRRGEYDGYLLYVDGEPAGWCQVGRRDRLQKLLRDYALEPAPDVWALTCFVVAPRYRRQGLAGALLDETLMDLQRRGVRQVEAYPRRGASHDGELWTGPEPIFRAAGFRIARDDAERPVLVVELAANEAG